MPAEKADRPMEGPAPWSSSLRLCSASASCAWSVPTWSLSRFTSDSVSVDLAFCRSRKRCWALHWHPHVTRMGQRQTRDPYCSMLQQPSWVMVQKCSAVPQ